MVKIFPFIFILLWSSAFITTKPIIDNSDPFAALAFRFALVALGFFIFSIYSKEKILISRKNFLESFLSGVLFHGFYLGGVFYSIDMLPEFWKNFSMINPLYWMINGLRYATLGIADTSHELSLGISILFALTFSSLASYMFAKGYGIKS